MTYFVFEKIEENRISEIARSVIFVGKCTYSCLCSTEVIHCCGTKARLNTINWKVGLTQIKAIVLSILMKNGIDPSIFL